MPKLVSMIDQKIAVLEAKRADWNAAGMTCYLYTNVHIPTAYDTLSDYSPTTVTGVTGQPVTWPAPASDQGDGTAKMTAPFVVFQPTGTGIVEDIIGWFVIRNDTGVLVQAQAYDSPIVNFGSTLEGLVVVPQEVEIDVS